MDKHVGKVFLVCGLVEVVNKVVCKVWNIGGFTVCCRWAIHWFRA